MKVDPTHIPRVTRDDGVVTAHLSDAGGLTQFGACHETLPPGATSSRRHWHTSEDEFLYVLDGTATVVDDAGRHDLAPGDAALWRHGDPNAHHVTNRSTLPCTYLIVGSRVLEDVCHYPDHAQQQVNTATTWSVRDENGTELRGGDLPPGLQNLPPVWGTPYDPATPAPRILRNPAHWIAEPDPTHPILGSGCGPYSSLLLSDLGKLSQFGAFIEALPPGSASSHRHWHEREDEMVHILSGTVTLVEDSETPLTAGDTACWAAGTPMGHRLENRSAAPARYLVIGTRHQRDVIHYSDHDLITHKDGSSRRYLHRDGTPWQRDT